MSSLFIVLCFTRPSLRDSNMHKLLKLTLAAGMLLFSVTQAGENTGISNYIEWATASELNNFGFDVWRGDREEGPFDRINENTIPGAGSSDTTNRYEFIDDTIEAGKAYWYYVESISMSGRRVKFSPTYQSEPRFPATDD